MPLPPEILESIKTKIDDAEAKIASVEDVITDLRATGIDASKQAEKLDALKEELRHLRLFYGKQRKRLEG